MRIDIRVYAKYARIIRVCVVRIYLSCTVCHVNDHKLHRNIVKVAVDTRGKVLSITGQMHKKLTSICIL